MKKPVLLLGVEGSISDKVGAMYYTFLVEDDEGLWNSTLLRQVDPERVDEAVQNGGLELFETPLEVLLPEDWKERGKEDSNATLTAVSAPDGAEGFGFPNHFTNGLQFIIWRYRGDAEAYSRRLDPDYWEFLDNPDRRYDNMCLAQAMGLDFLSAQQAQPLVNLLRRAEEFGIERDHAIEIIAEASRISRGESDDNDEV